MLESLLVGTFPIQSYTACVDEWISDGKTGLIVEPEDPHAIAEAIRRALTDDELVDNAAQINLKIVAEQLDYKTIQPEVIDPYRSIVEKQ
jgi:glycosyltransferase involved in cell wall biosynthesis